MREWITAVTARGVSARRIEYRKNSVLGAIFTTAVEDGVIVAHPSHRVASNPVPREPRRILTAAQLDSLYAALPDSDAQLLVETAIETGLRWGELTELQAADIDVATGLLSVSRANSRSPAPRSWAATCAASFRTIWPLIRSCRYSLSFG